ncbi:DUF397 domain-containing protein [Streptomyces sp. NRRL S-350]|uniref:DUF397 domain-containing protein n=1 Tax=Streptomyces sp. NRRL S-350 TaxID=1463902 RepID=UPI00068EAA1F|nr:DUF397 domain-containing protein [Streptomyces sp. NRRL S-350]
MDTSLDQSADENVVWHKSSYSGSQNSNCCEVGRPVSAEHGAVAVRDTKDRAGGTLHFSPESWSAFLSDIQAGDPRLTGDVL